MRMETAPPIPLQMNETSDNDGNFDKEEEDGLS